ncbi:hypothetical protein AWH62_06195 [Maricaulis sp. W15]|uniref:N-acetyltransferase domain-containing protein n=1 Tax=Maricaulis maris TaxID=74318 RepID=A0A495D6U8_9PROT|nr:MULTISPECIES: hypothetical protein [Maricaulis]OLF75409.1 hypothetical protein AWH62_06195 [Maricaulis sp. W15]RKQ96700.1 hypothetical protein C7435_2033 [Maricaulis maris]
MVGDELQFSSTETGFEFPLDRLDQAFGSLDFKPVQLSEIDEFHALADELIDGEIASAEDIGRVQEWTRRSLHMRRWNGRPDGFVASIPLSDSGVAALLRGEFGFANARREWVCDTTEKASALLSWGLAGRTPHAQAAALRALLVGWRGFYADVRVYARARTTEGKALMRRLNFEICAYPDGASPLYGSTGFPQKLGDMLLKRTVLGEWESRS